MSNEYCELGNKPTVKYSFKGGKERSFKTDLAPIEVISKESPVEANDSFNNDGYHFTVYSTNNFRNFSNFCRAHRFVDKGGTDPMWRWELEIIGCGGTKWERTVNVNPSTFVIDSTRKCPGTQKLRCSIIVKHQGQPIFQDQGDCPVSFSVQCGNCPDGQIECKKAEYPGYCCIPCQGTAQKINNIGNKING